MFVSSNLRFYAGFPSARRSQTSHPLRELTSKSAFGTNLNRNISFHDLTLPAGKRSLVLRIPKPTVSQYSVSSSSLYLRLRVTPFRPPYTFRPLRFSFFEVRAAQRIGLAHLLSNQRIPHPPGFVKYFRFFAQYFFLSSLFLGAIDRPRCSRRHRNCVFCPL